MKGMRRALVAAAVAALWAALATAVEHALATWAPPAVWWRIAGVNLGIALAVTLPLAWATRRRGVRLFAGAQLAAAALSLALIPENVRGPGPVLWVVCDTLRADAMSLYGYPRPTSPFLEEWARDLVVFDEAYSQASHTIVTAPSILASLHPSTHRLQKKGDALDSRATLVSEILHEAGFATVGVFSNPHLRSKSGFDQGWDDFRAPTSWQHMSSAQINRFFFRWREQHTEDQPYFALLWYIDPHTPFQWDAEAAAWARLDPAMTFRYKPPLKDERATKNIREQTRRRYDAALRTVDNSVRSLVAFLREQGDYDDALILFTSDHGESLWEHGRFGHNYGLYQHLTHVPLAIRFPAPLHFPAFAQPSGRVPTIASSVDLLPTTLAFLGRPIGEEIQGRSLLPDLVKPSGGTAYLEQRLTHYGPYQIFGMREGRFKYIWVEEFEGDREPRALLFDLDADPGEKRNLAAVRPELAAEFHARVAALRRAYEAVALEPGSAALDPRTRAMLEKMGYIDAHGGGEAAEAPAER
jgi:arylsulfatase A-like enzyme